MIISKLASLAVLSVLSAIPATADEPLPVIVTYEMSHDREVLRASRRDPSAFWIHQIVSGIEARRTEAPVDLKQPVTVRIAFTVAKDGKLVGHSVQESSGVPSVDATAMAMVEKAQPFPPMPPGLPEHDRSFTLPVRFR